MKRILLLLLFFLCSFEVYPQAPSFVWAESAGTSNDQQAAGIAIDASGNVYTCGYIRNANNNFSGNLISSSGGEDIFISKYDVNGNFLWVIKAGGLLGNDEARAITVDAAGNIYITGFFANTATFFGSPNISLLSVGSEDMFVAKYDPSGNVLWAKSAGSLLGNDEGSSICTDGTNVFVTGFYVGTANFPAALSSAGGSDMFVASYDAITGSVNWDISGGSNDDDIGSGIASDASGVYVTGTFGDDNILFQNLSGNLGNIGGDDVFLVKYDLTGNGLWKLRMGSNPGDDAGSSVSVNGSNVYVGGSFSGNMNVYDAGGGSSVTTITSTGSQDAFVAQYNSTTGSFGWIKNTAGTSTEQTNAVTTNPLGDVFIAGNFTGTIPLAPGPSINSTATDPFIIKYNSSGTLLWGRQIQGANTDVANGIVSPNSIDILVCGYMKSTPGIFDLINLNSVGNYDIFFGKMGCDVMISNAGPDQTICAGIATLAANTPGFGTGLWTLVSGTGTITTPTSPTSTVTGLGVGANTFRWTVSSGSCTSVMDDVIITKNATPTVSNAGIDQTICASTTTLTGNTPAVGTGFWTIVSGTGTITAPASSTSGLTGLGVGANIFRWTISNGVCTSSMNDVTVNVNANPSVSNAGPDQSICSSTTTLAGITPVVGLGFWTLVSGTGTITTPTSPTSALTGLGLGANTFRWTISNGTCPSSFDDVVITVNANPTVSNAGTDQTICSSTTTLAGNTPVVGTGLWTLVSGTGTITTAASPTSGITGLGVGANIFRWTISSGTCPVSMDDVIITVNANPTVSNAGTDQNICSSSTSLAGNTPVSGTGLWTLVSGTGTITTTTSPSSGLTGLGIGANTFRWTISNGICPSSIDSVIINVNANPSVSNAGTDQTICPSTTTLAGNTPVVGTGLWTLVSGTGTITTPASPTSGLTGLGIGANTFRWTISSGACPPSMDDVIINRNANPTVSLAGTDQNICSSVATLAGNTPVSGTGLWTLVSGTGTITAPTSSTSGLTGLGIGANTFRWTISNGICPASMDDVIITVNANPSVSNAGTDQTICSPTTTLAGNTPTVGTGLWTIVSGAGTIITASSPTSVLTGLGVGANIFRWTISSGACPASMDDVTITVNANPSISNAGSDQTICSSTTTLTGNTPIVGTGLWTLVSGSGTITIPTSSTSGLTGLGIGANIFRWTISNGICPASMDDVIITVNANPSVSNAGTDQTICSSTATLAGNTPTVGTGLWTIVSGAGTIITASSPTSVLTGLGIGANTFRWTISNGTCPASMDDVIINVDAFPTIANAGTDQTICSSTATLTGNIPVVGTGLWTIISGTIATPTSPTSGVTGLSSGVNSVRWTISNGTCPDSFDDVIINVDPFPTTANAGTDQNICSSTTTFGGNTPAVGTGLWTIISGSGTITTPTSPSSGLTGLGIGTSIFRWTISNGTCPSSSDSVIITVDPFPTTAIASLDQTICSSSTSFTANSALVGTGVWTLVSGTGTITTPTSPTSGVTGLGVGANIFRWTISSGSCPPSTDDVIINVDAFPTASNAGTDQTICSSTVILAGNIPVVGTGLWTVVSGTGTIAAPSSPNSIATGLSIGSTIFVWTTSNGTCPSSIDSVIINVNPSPTTPVAGPDQTICSSSAIVAGNTPLVGTGLWTLVSGTGTITSPTSSTSGITGLGIGVNTLRWTISSGTCPLLFDDILITVDANPMPANAGADIITFHDNTNLAATAPLIGTGTWSVISGTANFGNSNDPLTGVTGLHVGENILQWTISNGVCPATFDDVSVIYNKLSVPNGFSPNEDGVNDIFEIPGLSEFSNVILNVYNRWGNIVYKNSDYRNTWDGKNMNGENLSDDTYYYTLEIKDQPVFKGYIIIKRK